ncbi:MAG TPA: hypothetical protein VL651_02520 [Bacteroidia bacterium]|jgi:hypothetical protein|nr:hypothetical protein [Bacteroidia bacterium]
MELKRISGQQKITLYEFYKSKGWPSNSAKMMCDLITSLESIDHEPVWAFTSLFQLLLTNKDDYKTWQVLITLTEVDRKQFYKITVAQDKPWHHLTGFTDNPIEAAELIVSGLAIASTDKGRNIFLDSK